MTVQRGILTDNNKIQKISGPSQLINRLGAHFTLKWSLKSSSLRKGLKIIVVILVRSVRSVYGVSTRRVCLISRTEKYFHVLSVKYFQPSFQSVISKSCVEGVGGSLCRHYNQSIKHSQAQGDTEGLTARTSQLYTGICRGERAALGGLSHWNIFNSFSELFQREGSHW